MPADARTTILAVAGAAQSPAVDAVNDVRIIDGGLDATGRTCVSVESRTADYGQMTLGLRGAHQVSNAAVTVCLLEALSRVCDIPLPAIRAALCETRWPGRLEMLGLPTGTRVILDAAHNGDGARALARHLAAIGWNGAACVLGVMRDKDAGEMIDALTPHVSSFVVTQASTPRARAADDLARMVAMRSGVPTQAIVDVSSALDVAFATGGRVVVCGSIYLLGDVMPLLARRGARAL
jgi:dihydrofolate synthase/folylpolyglutamate synthase